MIAGTYHPGLVALSVIIAIVASYAAFNLAERVSANSGQRRWIWLTSGAVAMGSGIWSMHYVGMLTRDEAQHFNSPCLVEKWHGRVAESSSATLGEFLSQNA